MCCEKGCDIVQKVSRSRLLTADAWVQFLARKSALYREKSGIGEGYPRVNLFSFYNHSTIAPFSSVFIVISKARN
jgi:hypothetical protein